MDLIYDFQSRGTKSKYVFLYEKLRNDIISGKLDEGSKMPSKRNLAKANDISVRTVAAAYGQLTVEGYLYTKERSGYYVVSDFNSNLRTQNAQFSIATPEEDPWLVDFTANTCVYEKFPISTWTRTVRQVLGDYGRGLIKRGDFLGSGELRLEISKRLYQTRGMAVSPDCIVVGTGIEYLYSRLIRLLPEDAVYAVEDPGYRKIRRIFEDSEVPWASIPMNENGIQMAKLYDTGATIVHTSPEHHYPLGTVTSAKRRQQLLNWLGESGKRYIIEDDYDCEFRYNGRSIPALYGLDSSERVIYMNTFSKTLSPAIRISYMVLPKHLMQAYINTTNFYSNTSSNLEQFTLARFIHDGYFDRHLNRMRKYYLTQGNLLRDIVAETPQIPTESISRPDTGTHLLVQLHTKLSDNDIKEKAALCGINLRFLSEFCVENPEKYEHTLVLNYSSLDSESMKKAVEALGEVFG